MHLLFLELWIDLKDLNRRRIISGVFVDADDDGVACIDCELRLVGRLLDLPLDVAGFDRCQRSARGLDTRQQLARAVLDLASQLLDVIRAGERIDRVGDAGLEADDLLRAQRDSRRVLGRQRQRLVAPVGVQRLRAAHDRRHGLHRDADDVVVGLLRRQRAARRLRVEAQLLRPRVGRAEPVLHDPRPQPPRRAELCDLLEEVVVGVEEERQPLAERIDVEARAARRLHIRDRVRERERHLLDRRRSRFADVIPADRNRVPLRHILLTVRKYVRHDPAATPAADRCRCPRAMYSFRMSF